MSRNCVVDAWQQHEGELRGYLNRILGDPMQAEDLLQDTFLKAVAIGSTFCCLDNSQALLFQIARNLLVDHYEKHFVTEDIDAEFSSPEEEIPAVNTLSECLPNALNMLDWEDREAIERCDLEGMKQIDFAAHKGLSLAGTKSRVQRARRRLKKALQALCYTRYENQVVICCYSGPNGT
ncbi:MAG: sigma-70 family RNA polymerase sigma factor [Candidatus Thiodiazotropha sp. L084R]